MDQPPVYFTPTGMPRALGRDTDATVASWDEIIKTVPVAPHIFQGAALEESPNIRRFYHASFLSQRSRGYCTGFNWTGTVMTRLRIPEGATKDTGTPLPKIQLSPLYTYDVGRRACSKAGFNMGMGDGLIGSCVSQGTKDDGVTLLEDYDSSPRAIDSHRNGTYPPSDVISKGQKHLVKEFALAKSFDHFMELMSGGLPCAFASSIPSGMMHCDPNTGFFRMTGSVVGGHEYQVIDFSKKENKVWVCQAWEHWGLRTEDPEFAPMNGFTQMGYCPLDEMERWFSDRAMSSGSSEIMFPNTVDGWTAPVTDFSSM
jgi:hypothetical protein